MVVESDAYQRLAACSWEQPRRLGMLSSKQEIKTAKQETWTIMGYSSFLQDLVQEVNHYQGKHKSCCEYAATLERFTQKDRISDFLVDLNVEFDAIRV